MSLNSFENLTNRVFLIPNNQRGFAWTKEQFEALISDMEISRALEKSHYVGPVVVESTGEEERTKNLRDLKVVTLEDGQQRVTTLMIMSCLLAKRIKSTFKPTDSEHDVARDLERCYSWISAGGNTESLLRNENPEFRSMIDHILLGLGQHLQKTLNPLRD